MFKIPLFTSQSHACREYSFIALTQYTKTGIELMVLWNLNADVKPIELLTSCAPSVGIANLVCSRDIFIVFDPK